MLCNYVITPKERPKVYFPWYLETKISSEANIFSLFPANFQRFSLKFVENIAWWSGKKLVLGKFFFVSLKSYSLQAGSHLGAHARAEKSEFESEAILREESGDEARRKWALISVKFSFLLRLSEVKYHWSKSGKGDKTVNLLCFTRNDQIPRESVIYGGFNSQHRANLRSGVLIFFSRREGTPDTIT